MPYKSAAQRGYLHAHPEITDKKGRSVAAKWDKKYGGKIKKNKGEGWLKPVIAGTVAGGLANQFPRVQDIERDARRKKKKGRVSKAYAQHVHSDDPEFNHIAAKKAFDLVMKMDDDAAVMFSHIAISNIFETDVQKNLRTLQGHLDEVLTQRLEMVAKALDRVIAKGDNPQAEAYGQALTEITKAVVNPYIAGLYEFQESDFRRDPHSGQFRAKIKHNQKTPFSNKVANGMGLVPNDPANRAKYARMTKEQKAQYQDEYRQLAGFLNVAAQSNQGAPGDRVTHLRFEDKQGNEFRIRHMGDASAADHLLLNPHYTLLEADSTPDTLTAGGAAFSLAQAMGAPSGDRTGQRIASGNAAVAGLPDFGAQWRAHPPDMKASNERLYNRVGAAGAYAGQIAPDNTKVAAAAKLAEVVGSHGAEAEAVIGPTARKTAYRYRGTEKKPDQHIVTLYSRAINAAKGSGAEPASLVDPYELKQRAGRPGVTEEEALAGTGVDTATRKPTRVKAVGGPGEAKAVGQMGVARALNEHRAPTWAERSAGRRVIQDQLRATLPSQALYNLQAESGNLPPSEGIMLNKDGQIVTQAVGYGDDHYLPFDLKNLKGLKGGEYIRTRSAGGLTSEDIYTGLITGARRVTVVSRSGTFSMEFEPDFRGGRRYNDKALRMTRRYEHLLDAVQSNRVSTGPVDPRVRQAITNEVAEEYPGERGAAFRTKVQARINEYQEDPEMTPDDERRMRFIAAQAQRDGLSRDETEALRGARALIMSGKVGNYKLDAAGYEAAQDALAEQFPYYIRSQPVIDREDETINAEKDKGYVEPGRNRPTAVKAGLFGTEANAAAGATVGAEKFSASQADYQRGRMGPGRGDRTPNRLAERDVAVERRPEPAPAEVAGETPATPPVPGQPERTPQEQAAREQVHQDNAVNLFMEIQQLPLDAASRTAFEDVIGTRENPVDAPTFAAAVQDPEHQARFDELVNALRNHLNSTPAQRNALRSYMASRGDLHAVAYDPRLALRWTPDPMTFAGETGYGPDATDTDRDAQIRAIDSRSRSVTTGLTMSQLAGRGDEAMRNELDALRQVYQEVGRNPGIQDPNNIDERRTAAQRIFGDRYDRAAINLIVGANNEDLINRMTDVHRMRNLKAHYQGAWTPGALATRDPGHDPLAQAVTDVGKAAQVRQRVEALRRYRIGKEPHEETSGDRALSDAEQLLTRIEAGGADMPTTTDVDNMLESTKSAFLQIPDRGSRLDAEGRRWVGTHQHWFTTDADGYLVFTPPENYQQGARRPEGGGGILS